MKTNDALFAFIRSGLQIENEIPTEKVNWNQLYNLASEQGVIAIVAEGVSKALEERLSTEGLDTELRLQFAFDMIGTGMKARWQILRNKYRERWKYDYFSDQSFKTAMVQQLWGYISEHTPTRGKNSKCTDLL